MKYLIFFALLICNPAYADNIFDPSANDKAMYVLSQIFGDLGIFGAGNDAMVAGMTVYLGAVLSIGGILAAYTILAGTIGTAHDGEMLGKKFSSVWIPIRYSVGVAMILPTVKGYCLATLLVGWLIVQSIGLAGSVWNAYLSNNGLKKLAAVGSVDPNAKALGYSTLQSLVCMSVLKNALDEEPILNGGSVIGISLSQTPDSKVINFGDSNSHGLEPDACGKIEVAKYQAIAPIESSGAISKVVNAIDANAIMLTMSNEHYKQTGVMIQALMPIAERVAKNGEVVNASEVDTIIANYEQTIKKSAASEILKLEPFKELAENAKADGFLLAGAWIMKIASLQDLTDRSIGNSPTASGPNHFNVDYLDDKMAKAMIPLAKMMKSSSASNITFGVGNEAGGSNSSWYEAIKDTALSGFDMTIIMKKAFTSTTNFVIQDGENPILSLKRMGNYLLMTGTTAWATLGLLSSTIGNAPGIGLMLQSVVSILIGPVLLVGFVLSYVLPNFPFFLWIGAMVGWLVMCIQAMIAAPMWMVMHLNPTGDDLAGSGKAGYSLLLGLILRPVLMVFGLIAAIVLVEVVGGFVNLIYADVFAINQQGSNIFIWVIGGLIAAPVIYCGLMYTVIRKSFDLIHVMPDQLLAWFGGGGPQLGGDAKDFGGNQSTAFVAMSTLSKDITSGVGKGASKTASLPDKALVSENLKDNPKESKPSPDSNSGELKKDINPESFTNMNNRNKESE